MPEHIDVKEIARRRLFPKRVHYQGPDALVELVRVPEDSFSSAFSHHDLEKVQDGVLIPLDLIGMDSPGYSPAGFIYHLSHVGSTAAAAMLRALPNVQVVAEPNCLGDCLLSPLGRKDDRRLERLFKTIQIFAATGHALGRETIIKFPSWTLLYNDDLFEAFPNTPSCLLYRNPADILVSLTQSPPGWLQRSRMRGLIGSAEESKRTLLGRRMEGLLGDTVDYFDPKPYPEFLGDFLAGLLESAIAGKTSFLLIEQCDIVPRVIDELPNHFGLPTDATTRGRALELARYDAKSRRSNHEYRDDTARKEIEATPLIREVNENRLRPLLNQLILNADLASRA